MQPIFNRKSYGILLDTSNSESLSRDLLQLCLLFNLSALLLSLGVVVMNELPSQMLYVSLIEFSVNVCIYAALLVGVQTRRIFLYTVFLFLLIDVFSWFSTEGFYGVIPYVIVIHGGLMSMANNSYYRRRHIWILFLSLLFVLAVVQLLFPAWIASYPTLIDKLIAAIITLSVTMLLMLAVIWKIDKHCRGQHHYLENRNVLLQKLIEAMPSAIHIADGEGNVALVNQKSKAWEKKTWDSLFSNAGESIKVAKSGGRWIQTQQFDLDQSLYLQIATDITDQQGVYQEFQMLSLVASQTDNMVVITDGQGLTEWVNAAFTKTTGYSFQEMLGKKPGTLLQGEKSDKNTRLAISEAIRAHTSINTEIINYTKSGNEYWVQISISPVFNTNGELEKFISIQRDVTLQKAAQENLEKAFIEVQTRKNAVLRSNLELSEAMHQLQQAQAQLVSSEKMASLGIMMAGVAHEINNPLNFIHGGIQAMEPMLLEVEEAISNSKDIGEDTQEAITTIKDLVYHMKTGSLRIGDILNSMRIFLNTKEDRTSFIKIDENIEATLTILHHQYKGRIEIVRSYKSPPQIECYAGHINQLIMNLLMNAIEAIPEKGTIDIRIFHTETELTLSIADSGVGIAPDVLPHISDAFFTTKTNKKNVGLGLSIVSKIVEIHDGHFSIRSEKGKGTTVVVSLPRQVKPKDGA